MDNKNKWGNIVVEVWAVLLIAALIVYTTIFDGYFLNNDDITMRNIITGVFTNGYESHAVFLMYPLSFLLKCLYSVIPQVPWYGLTMVVLHYFCIYLIVRRAGQLAEGIIHRIILTSCSFAVLALLDYKYLVMEEFTVLAGVLAATAIFYLSTSKEYKWSELILIAILLLFSAWYRKSVLEMSLPFCAIGVLFNLAGSLKEKERLLLMIKRALIVGMAFGVLFAGSVFIHKQQYSSDEWKEYISYNHVRSDIYDHGSFLTYSEYSDYAGGKWIPENKYVAITEQRMALLEDVTKDELSVISSYNNKISEEWKQYYNVPKKIIDDVTRSVIRDFSLPVLVVLFVTFAITFSYAILKKRIDVLLAALGVFGYFWFVITYCVTKGRYIERVAYTMYLMSFLLLIAILLSRRSNEKIHWFYNLCKVGIFAVLLLAFGEVIAKDNQLLLNKTKEEVAYWETVNEWTKTQHNKVILVDTSLVPMNASAFNESASASANQIWLTNWLIKSPIWNQSKEKLAVNDVKVSFASDDRVEMIAAKECEWVDSLFEGYEVLKTYDESYGFFKITVNKKEK